MFINLKNIYKTLEDNSFKVINQNPVYSKILFKNFKAFLKKIWQLFRQRLYLFLKLGLSLGLFACTFIDPFDDTTPPTLTVSIKTSPLEKNIPNKIIFTFDENVSNFTSDKINFEIKEIKTGTKFLDDIYVLKSKFVTNSHSEYLLGITPKKSGNMTIKIPAYTVKDNANNFNPSNFTTNFFINRDTTSPTLTISTKTSPLEKGSPINIFFTFNEDVTNFTPDDIKISGVKVNTIKFTTNSKKEYIWYIAPIDQGDLKIKVPAGNLQDLTGNSNTNFIFDIPISPSGTFTYTISFIPNGAIFSNPKITNLKVNKDNTINKDQLKEILSYPSTGPKPNIQAVTRNIFQWQNNEKEYEFFTPVTNDLTLEAVWSNNCGKVETFHPDNRDKLKTYIDKATSDNATTNLNHIDTSTITNMNSLFSYSSFNGKVDCWNVANVTDMFSMFENASKFNQNISNWNVANVTDMSSMFENASKFNQNISNWNVANVTDMSSMLKNASKFNQNIGNWNIANVTYMFSMFKGASSFNQNISNWNIANVTDMSSMFENASKFNQNIGNWNVANITYMFSMFKGASSFNQNISNWDVSKVISMSSMFQDASSFNQNIDNWNVAKVISMSSMFQDASSFNQNISNWNVSNVTYMSSMFQDASSFNQNIDNWNVANVTYMSSMFKDASSFNQNIGNWNVANVTYMSSMFKDASSFNQNISNWDVSKVISMSSMFENASKFNQNIGNWNVSNVTDMTSMFKGASSFNQNISNWNVSKAISMSSMFQDASSFNQNISNWNVANVTYMSSMFKDASSFNQNIGNWNVANVTYMSSMFKDASSFNQNISNWDVSKVISMSSMFENASKFNQNIGNWNVANVTYMSSMFKDASSFNQDLTIWPVRQVTVWDDIFNGSAMEEKNKPQKFK